MNEVTHGQAVVVTDRRHYLSYEEGRVVRAEPDGLNRVRVMFPDHKEQASPESWHAIELDVLEAMPVPGERYEWADRNNASRVPFTVGERFLRGHMYAGLFRIMSDDATDAERSDGHTSIASAAEIAKFAEPTTKPAPTLVPPSLALRMRKWAEDGMPRPGQAADGGPGAPVLAFADEAQILHDNYLAAYQRAEANGARLVAIEPAARALADLFEALYATPHDARTMGQWDDVGRALRAYREAADS